MMTRNSTTTGVRPKAPTRLSVGTAAVQGSNTPCHGVIVKAMSPSQTIYVGASSAVTAADGYPLADSGTLTLEVTNTNQLWFIASAASQAVSLFPYTWL